jgi:hypothetical protein
MARIREALLKTQAELLRAILKINKLEKRIAEIENDKNKHTP